MVRMLCLSAVLLVVLVIGIGAQAQSYTLCERPEGMLLQRADGSYGYIVSPLDRVGQWQVAFGAPQLWLELVDANPQLADPDLIRPGDELNVPPTLVKLFRIIAEVDSIGGPQPAVSAGPLTVPEKVNTRLVWLLIISACLVMTIIILSFALSSTRKDRKLAWKTMSLYKKEMTAERERVREANPYSGAPVVEGGLLTAESAARHFAKQYQAERREMTVAESEALPSIAILRIVPVDVRGLMTVHYADSVRPRTRDLPNWTPAWQCFFNDGSYRISLMYCGNDVRHGSGYDPLPKTQIRPRQDIPAYEPEQPVQIWPVVTATAMPDSAQAAPPAEPEAILVFTSMKADGPRKYVLHPASGQERIVDLSIIPGITLGIANEEIFVHFGDKRQVIGHLVAGEPNESSKPAEPAA